MARCNCPLTEREDQFQIVNNWTKTRGNHIIKFGADIRYARNLRIPSDNNRTGEYNFSPLATSNQTLGTVGGLDLATFLLGDVTSMARYVTNPILTDINNAAERQKRLFFYGQDTYRATSKLTVNFGLRWEIYTPESVLAKGYGGFANIVDNGGTGVIRVAGYGGFGLNGNVKDTFNAFAPRFGSHTRSLRKRSCAWATDEATIWECSDRTSDTPLPRTFRCSSNRTSTHPQLSRVPIPTLFRS